MMMTPLLLAVLVLKSSEPEFSPITPTYEHQITAIHNSASEIELEDGSKWTIAPTDAYKVVAWSKDENIVITPNRWWIPFYTFDYYLFNTTRQSYAMVFLTTPPNPFGKFSHWISALDRCGGYLFFANGARWRVYEKDIPTLKDWSVNDSVIFGFNDERFKITPYLLINARLKTHVRATQF